MMKSLLLLLLVFFVQSHIVDIGNCVKYEPVGQKCSQCVSGYHLFKGECFLNILNCLEYKTGNLCNKCSNTTILINNECSDSSSIGKYFKNENYQSNKDFVERNMQQIKSLIETSQNQLLKTRTLRPTLLIRIHIKTYPAVKRWILLFKIQNSYKRIVVDFNFKSNQQWILVDFSEIEGPQNFEEISWQQVENESKVLSLYPGIYPSSNNYTILSAKIALLSEIDEFQLITKTSQKLEIRSIYTLKGQTILVNEQIFQIGQVSAQSVSGSKQLNISKSTSSQQFTPYQLTFEGDDIDAEIDVNEALSAAVDLVKEKLNSNYTLKKVVQKAMSSNLTQFQLTVQNNNFSQKYVVSYSDGKASIVSVDSLNSDTADSKLSSSSSKQNTLSLNSNVNSSKNQNQISTPQVTQDGSTTHTSYSAPFSPEIQTLAQNLVKIKEQAQLSQFKVNSSQNPIIRGPTLYQRRIVMTQFCSTSKYREIALVQGDAISTNEYFTYYLEVADPVSGKQWYLLGNKNKLQSPIVYNNPSGFSIYTVDPSFVNYPYGNLFSGTSVQNDFASNLTAQDYITYQTITANLTSQKDRNMGNLNRFAVDGTDASNNSYKLTGWKVISPPQLLPLNSSMISFMCVAQYLLTQSVIIGSSGPQTAHHESGAINNQPRLLTVEENLEKDRKKSLRKDPLDQ